MRLLYGLAALLCVALGQAAMTQRGLLRDNNINADDPVRLCSHKDRVCVNLTLHCHHEENNYQVIIKPEEGATLPGSHVPNPVVPSDDAANIDNSGTNITVSGELNGLEVTETTQTCSAVPHDKECATMRTGSLSFHIERVVPGSQLVWVANYVVTLQCLFTPSNPENVTTWPNGTTVPLQQCEQFEHTLEVFETPLLEACIISVGIESSTAARRGLGYKLQKCYLNLPAQSVPLITNGKTQNSGRAEVMGRNADGGSGFKYQLSVAGLTAAQVRTGALHCEVERCRSSVVGSGEYSQCPQGLLPSDFSAEGRYLAPVLNTSQMTGTRIAGDVKLYIPRTSQARSSAALFEECLAGTA